MDVKWMMLANDSLIDREGRLTVWKVFNELAFARRPLVAAPFFVLVRYALEPTEATTVFNITVGLRDDQGALVEEVSTTHTAPDLATWASKTPIQRYRMRGLRFPDVGEYRIRLDVEGKTRAEERLLVRIRGGGGRE